jgi:hypothetical protein
VARSIQINVDEHDAIPDGCSMLFEIVGPERPVTQVQYDPDDAPAGRWEVLAAHPGGKLTAASAVPVSDSGAGTSFLVYGGEWGLRLRRVGGDEERAEPYLLLDEEAFT